MIRLRHILVLPLALLAGCALFEPEAATAPASDTPASAADPASAAPPPPAGARTADAFDTTTAEQRAAATAAPTRSAEARLGTTVISLGPPAEPGLWLRTGLVTTATPGRVEVPASGRSVSLELRPSGGTATGGSEISLAAMRLLEVPLTSLPEVVVYRR